MTMENILVSLFKGYADTCPIEVPLKTIISLLRDNQAVIEHTEKHRYYLEQKQVTAAAREKASCPCFAVSVRFEGGKQKANISGWTGICPVDIDHVPPERMEQCLELLKADKHTLLQYVTISGHGIRLLCRYTGLTDNCEKNHRLHTRTFTVINEYYTRLTGLECDLKCKNATRLSGLAHDEHLFFNPDAVPFSRNAETAAPKHSPASAKNHRRLQRVIDAACRRLADEGVEYAEHHHNEYIMRMGYLLNAYGVAQNVATQWATERFADYNGDVTGIFASCYLNIEEHGSLSLPPLRKSQNNDERQEFMASVADIEQFLNGQASFRKNTVTGKCEVLTAAGSTKNSQTATSIPCGAVCAKKRNRDRPPTYGQCSIRNLLIPSTPSSNILRTCHPGTEPPITSRNLPPTYTSGTTPFPLPTTSRNGWWEWLPPSSTRKW